MDGQISREDPSWLNDPDGYPLLNALLGMDTPSGDEDVLADWLEAWADKRIASATILRLGANLIVVRGKPRTAIFAHTDTTGFTLGYDRHLIPIGGPSPAAGDRLWKVGDRSALGTVEHDGVAGVWRLAEGDEEIGSRWVYGACPESDAAVVYAPYLDNRGGVWAALQTLVRLDDVAVAFTAGEEHNGAGAQICATRLYDEFGIDNALISDLTWDTDHVHMGQGVAVSLRDRNVPRQRFLARARQAADLSNVRHQWEVESEGGSDAAGIQRSGRPWNWVFVGAPERDPHTVREEVRVSDLREMADMLVALVERL